MSNKWYHPIIFDNVEPHFLKPYLKTHFYVEYISQTVQFSDQKPSHFYHNMYIETF